MPAPKARAAESVVPKDRPVPDNNAKGDLIAACRNLGLPDPAFVSTPSGPGHAPWFRCTVTIGEREAGQGEGRSRRDAERAASLEALKTISTPAAVAGSLSGPPSLQPDIHQPPTRWPIYADVLSQALLVAHERNEDGPLPEVAQDAATLYRALLTELGYKPDTP